MAAIAILKNIKYDNSVSYQSIKIIDIENCTIFDRTNSIECLFFRFGTFLTSKFKMAAIDILKKRKNTSTR